MLTPINNEDRLVQKTFADYLHEQLGWDSAYAWKNETFGPSGLLGRSSERDVVLARDLREAVEKLNKDLPAKAVDDVVQMVTAYDYTRSPLQHNRQFNEWNRNGVPIRYRDEQGQNRDARARLIDFSCPTENRFLAVRELKIQGLHVPNYNRRADIVCFVNGLPLAFIELKAVYKNIRAGFDGNLADYYDTIPHAFYHNAFVVVSNGDRARYGSITSKWGHFAEWKRNTEDDAGQLDTRVLLDGMFAKDRLLDLVENFILFDDSKSDGTRKIVARNHQVLGVNNAVASVGGQEELKKKYPAEERLKYEFMVHEKPVAAEDPATYGKEPTPKVVSRALPLVRRAHPDLGRLGVFWHTQGSGKSYSMVFFAEKVRRKVPGNFTFVIMTDREDLDDQIYRTFVGCGAADQKTPRARSGEALKRLLIEDHRYVFTLIQKFNQEVSLREPYSRRDDVIVLSDEAHRTQAGKMAQNMRLALPNAAFIGFTGTPILKHEHLTRRIFGGYVSRYDFKRSEDDGSTVKLLYQNRGEKLGLTRPDLNDRIAEKIEEAELDADQTALLGKLLGKDYEVITADDRLDKIATDFVEHCSTRWKTGKFMLVCVDKVTCGRMHQRIIPRWLAKADGSESLARQKAEEAKATTDPDLKERLNRDAAELQAQSAWMKETVTAVIVSEGQNEVRDFKKWGIDIRPHRQLMKVGFNTSENKRLDVDSAFKSPEHPFRVAIICAKWLAGFDVECLATLYIDKPMRAHNLMQAIARANRVYPGKNCGVIVDYNGFLKSLREALAQYAQGDGADDKGGEGEIPGAGDIVTPIDQAVAALVEAIEATEEHLGSLGFDTQRFVGAKGFARIEAIKDAANAVYTSDETKVRFEILARMVFERANALVTEPTVYLYAERHDNIEAIYKKLQGDRDNADVTEVLKELHRIVNEAIRAMQPGDDQAEGMTVDLSRVDFEHLREEFAKKARRKQLALQEIRDVVEGKLKAMLARNPQRMDFYKKYQEILADYNREKDRATVEETFIKLLDFAGTLDEEARRAVREGLSEEELALFDLIAKESITKADRERLKQASRDLLKKLQDQIQTMAQWTKNSQTRAAVKVLILDDLSRSLPMPPFTQDEADAVAEKVFDHVLQLSIAGALFREPAA